ncbi:MAG: hypothetical protein ACRCYY_20730 [Trueperaceae bacterium]
MIRTLAPDELAWFLSRSFAFLGHSDPNTLARRLLPHVRDVDVEVSRSYVLMKEAQAKAGVHALAPNIHEDKLNLYLSNFWFEDSARDMLELFEHILLEIPHQAAYLPLYNFSEARIAELEPFFKGLGFWREEIVELAFDLAEVPPLGLPVVLEAWSYTSDGGFREVYEGAEHKLSDYAWAYLKRWRSRFTPDLWFIARETLDQPPVGYAFFGAKSQGIDSVYYLTGAGVLQEHRTSSEMLRRVVISAMLELAAQSPLGRIETSLVMSDAKLVQIFESLGFDTFNRYKHFAKRPQ